MSFMDDLKTDQRTQILVAGMIFFAIAFPAYFGYAASNVDDYEVSGPIGTYFVDGTYSYHEIAADTVYVNDQSTETIIANSDDATDDLDGKNLVGVRAILTYSDDEQGGGFCTGYQSAPDDVRASLSHDSLLPEQSQVASGESITLEWIFSDIVGMTVENASVSDIEMLLDGELGEGEHILDISVTVAEGGGIGQCTTTDEGESISYVIELISLDYTIEKVEKEPEE